MPHMLLREIFQILFVAMMMHLSERNEIYGHDDDDDDDNGDEG